MDELYKNIKRFREAQDMSQEELALKAGYSGKSMISRIESGQVDLTRSKIIQFAEIFGVTPSELMGDTEETRLQKLPQYSPLIKAYEAAPKNIQDAIKTMLKVGDL